MSPHTLCPELGVLLSHCTLGNALHISTSTVQGLVSKDNFLQERNTDVNYIGKNTRHHLSVQIPTSENIPPKQGGDAKVIKGTIKESMKNLGFF